ncbi:hypothetical protein [Heliorestis convoluta]|uniref:hypothetical protein n=1 Tax=Heliorestis convoluta TaxID=356322 RepID=UPI001389A759|nr:hypothetical protein [Heliorestis convoluta]
MKANKGRVSYRRLSTVGFLLFLLLLAFWYYWLMKPFLFTKIDDVTLQWQKDSYAIVLLDGREDEEQVKMLESRLFPIIGVQYLSGKELELDRSPVAITFQGGNKKISILEGNDGQFYRPLLSSSLESGGKSFYILLSGDDIKGMLMERFFTFFEEPQTLLPQGVQERPDNQEGQLAQFIVSHLSNEQGGVFTNYRDDRPELADEARNHDILSESTGLLLEYALWTDDKALYRQQVNYVRKYLIGPYAIPSWKVKPDNREPAQSSALIDDIRIAAMLLKGAERWDDKRDFYLAKAILEGIYRYQLLEGRHWTPWFDWSGLSHNWSQWFEPVEPNGGIVVPVRYLQPAYLALIATVDSRYEPLVQPALDIIRQADLGNGLFMTDYSPERGPFQEQEAVNMINSMLAALHGAQVGYVSPKTASFLQKELQAGRIWAAYHRDQGDEPVAAADFRSPAVYALVAQYFLEIDEPQWAQVAVDHLLLYRVNDPNSIFYGGFGDPITGDCYSFDNLLALQALALVRQQK